MNAILAPAFATLLAIVFTFAGVASLEIALSARIFVLAIAAVMIPLSWLNAVVSWVRFARREGEGDEPEPAAGPSTTAEDLPATPDDRRAVILVIVWIAVFAASVWLLGFVIASPLMVFAYLRFAAREKWIAAALGAVVTAVVVFGLMDQVLRIALWEGLLFS